MPNGNQQDRGHLISQKYKPIGPECLQFWYYTNVQNEEGTLNILIKFDDDVYSTQVWSKTIFDTNGWHYEQVQIGDTKNEFSLVFEGVKNVQSAFFNSFIGIDDVTVKLGSCSPPINCNFEDITTCSWSQYSYDDLDWLLSQGQKGDSYLFQSC